MPFAWTAIYLTNIVNGASSLEREAERQEREHGRADSLGEQENTGAQWGFGPVHVTSWRLL